MTYMNTLNYDPAGDPITLHAGVNRTRNIVAELQAASSTLGTAAQTTAQAWEGLAAQVFLIVADTWTQVMGGLTEITEVTASSLGRYASILEQAQEQSMSARRRLHEVTAAATPATPADPALVASLNRQIEEAHANADQAGRELANICSDLAGPDQSAQFGNQPTDVNASFVSMAHGATANGVSTAPGAAFDAQMAQLRQQSVNIFSAMSQRPLPVNPAPQGVFMPPISAPPGVFFPSSGSPSGDSNRKWIEGKYWQHIGSDPSGLSDQQIHDALNKNPSMIKETNNMIMTSSVTSSMIAMNNSRVAETIRTAENTAVDNMYNPHHPNYGRYELPWFPGGSPMTIP